MLSVLDDAQYTELANLAQQYQLDVLTEVSNEQEVLRACALKAKIIGINNRDLRDLSTDLATTERLVPLIKQHATHKHVVISESGIYTYKDVRRLAPIADGFLVGSSLMGEKDIALAAKQLVYGKVKICGTTSLTGAKLVKDSPASFAGLIFAEKSKRFVTLEQAKQITYAVPFYYVGVFVNAPIEQVVNYAKELTLIAVQLHGNENQTYIDALRKQLPTECQIWLAKGVKNTLPALDERDVDCFLLDCQVGEQSGGTGQAFSWQLLDDITDKSNIVLAGGITPNNVKQAANIKVAMLDLNSGVESTPGIKQQDKINQAFSQLRNY
jgi:indole-3-glycerol phosphate synthase/phosphoribosylanthranilate isomerase